MSHQACSILLPPDDDRSRPILLPPSSENAPHSQPGLLPLTLAETKAGPFPAGLPALLPKSSQVKLLASPFKMAAAARRLLLDGCCSALFEESSSRTSGVCALHIEQRRRERRPVSWAPTSIGANVLAAHERRHVRDSTAVRFHSDRRHRRCPLSVRHLP